MKFLKVFFKWNYTLSMKLDSVLLDSSYRTYGTSDFHKTLIPQYITDNALVYDIGGGKAPHIFPALKTSRKIQTVGVDIDAQELARAPHGAYERTMCLDITKAQGPADGDFVISRATLEHVEDARKALMNMATFIKPGGRMIVFAPCRNAWFARLNMMLPEGIKRKIIDYFYEDSGLAPVMGFKAYYNRGTPKQMESIMKEAKLKIVDRRIYYMSNYFAFIAPVHAIWRLYQIIMRTSGSDEFCEGFAYVLEKSK